VLVKDVMTPKPTYCTPYWTVDAVAALMDHAGSGIVPVVEDLLQRKLVGVITDRDLCLRVIARQEYPAHMPVSACMTSQPTCCHPDDPIEIALQLLADRRVRRLPVVGEEGQLLGMISISDFIRSHGVDDVAVLETLKRICSRSAKAGDPQPTVPHAA